MEENEFVDINYPRIFKNKIKHWPILKFTDNEWIEIFGEQVLNFRGSKREARNVPCWESSCITVQKTMREFFQVSKEGGTDWLYWDYKAFRDVDSVKDKLKQLLDWSCLNEPGINIDDSTLWIGNDGAHTPCHYDTYGHNYVAQIFGRKLWILVPPEGSSVMRPTRVPYEESSIYSEINFFSPNQEIVNLGKVFIVVLEPGDVLHVPRHWWHYVENLQVAISVNVWVPMMEDYDSRLDEALVQRQIWSVIQDLSEEEAKKVLNPNEYDLIEREPSLEVLKNVALECLKVRASSESKEKPAKKVPRLEENIIETSKISNEGRNFLEYLSKSFSLSYSGILRPVNQAQLKEFILEKDKKLGSPVCLKKVQLNPSLAETLINSLCHPETVKMAREKFLERIILDEIN